MAKVDRINLTDLRNAAREHQHEFYRDKIMELADAIESDRKSESPFEWEVPLHHGRRALVRLPRYMTEADWSIMREVLSGWLDLAHDAMVVGDPDNPFGGPEAA